MNKVVEDVSDLALGIAAVIRIRKNATV